MMQKRIKPSEDKTCVFELTKQECADLAQYYDLERISSFKGRCTIAFQEKDVPCYWLEGFVEATVTWQQEEFVLCEPLSIYLIKQESDLEKFSLEDDVEVLNQDGSLDVGDIMAQYMYLGLMERQEEVFG